MSDMKESAKEENLLNAVRSAGTRATQFKYDLATVLDLIDRWVDDQPKVDLFQISYERGGQRVTLSVERAGQRQSPAGEE